MKTLVILALIFCTLPLAEMCFDFQRIDKEEWADGRRINGDVLIMDKLFHKDNGLLDNVLEVKYPSSTAPYSYYKITRIEIKYKYQVDCEVLSGGVEDFHLRLEVNAGNSDDPLINVKVYGLYVGPC